MPLLQRSRSAKHQEFRIIDAVRLADDTERGGVKKEVLEHRELIPLHDRETGERAGRFTTQAVREQEQNALADAAALGRTRGISMPLAVTLAVLEEGGPRADQRAAFDHAIDAGGLKLIEGRAGTGKSHTLGVIRGAYERAGHRVIGLAPTKFVAQDLKTAGFGEAGTVHSALFLVMSVKLV